MGSAARRRDGAGRRQTAAKDTLMRKVVFLPVLGLALLIAGCVPPISLHPLFTDEDLIFEPALLGTWLLEQEGDWCSFEQADEKEYRLTCVVEGDRAEFEARLLRLGSHTFLDTYPNSTSYENELFFAHLTPGHIFSRVSLEGESLKLTHMDVEWLGTMLEAGTVKIRHERFPDGIFLTAPTAELQAFFLEHADNADAFSIGETWKHAQTQE
jgi:hypothetical protein